MGIKQITAVCVLMVCSLPAWCRHFRIDLGYRMLYFGIPNPIIADAYGYQNGKLFLMGDSCHVTKEHDSLYTVTAFGMGAVTLYLRTIYGKDTVTVGKREFYVVPPLPPVVTIAGKASGGIAKNVLAAQQGILVPFNCFDFSLKNYVVAGFTLTILKNDGTYKRAVNSEDGLFTAPMQAMIRSLSVGDRLLFSGIKGQLKNDPQHLKYDMHGFEVTVL